MNRLLEATSEVDTAHQFLTYLDAPELFRSYATLLASLSDEQIVDALADELDITWIIMYILIQAYDLKDSPDVSVSWVKWLYLI
jgi:hypothetical protein